MLPPSGIFSANCCFPFDAISLLDITLFWEWWPRLVPGSAPLLLLKLFSVFYTLACGAVHAALSWLKDAFEIPHANKPKPKEPQHLIHSYSSMFLGVFSLCFFLSPSLCASHVFRKHEAKTILSRIPKSSYNFNLSSSCPGSSFPLKYDNGCTSYWSMQQGKGWI